MCGSNFLKHYNKKKYLEEFDGSIWEEIDEKR